MAKHPPVGSAKWFNLFSDEKVNVYQDTNDDIFFKVIIAGNKPKYFYNETVWSDVPRYVADVLGGQYWSVLD
jgi:hypothetical protein